MAQLKSMMTVFLLVVSIAVIFLTFSVKKESKTFRILQKDNLSQEKEPGDVEDNQKVIKKLKLRKPNPELLSELSQHFKSVEDDTEPLPLSAKCQQKVFLILMVVSSPDGFVRRNAIRGTWSQSYHRNKHKKGNVKEFSKGEIYRPKEVVKVVFLIGYSENREIMNLVETEAKTYGDIVLGGLHEHYRNLTMKTRLGLKWAYYHCEAKYILKTDDDVFINPVPLVEWLKVQSRSKFYSGWCNFGSPVVRDPNNKWYISREDFAGSSYPGYCLGGGYIMSDDVLGRILQISYGRKLFPMEDLYVGLMVKDLGDIAPLDNKQSFNLVFGGIKGCGYNKLYLAHPVSPEHQLKMLLEAEVAQRNC